LLRHGLRFGVYQILFLDRIPDYAAVGETVAWAKALGGRPWGGLVNAVLRRILERRESYLQLRAQAEGETLTLPPWLWRRWVGRYGEAAALSLLRGFNQVPDTFLRANPKRGGREAVLAHLRQSGVAVREIGTAALFQIPAGAGA